MAMKRCPICGEKYSDTYKHCPFCEEEEDLRSGNTTRRKGGHRVAQSGPSILSPVLIVAILALACVLVYLLFGNTIAEKLGIGKTNPSAPAAGVSDTTSSQSSASSGMEAPDISGAASGSSSAQASSSAQQIDTENLPETLTVSNSDFTMTVGENPVQISVTGGSGSYTWESEDDGVASVDADGRVTAISAGTVTLTVTDGSEKGTAIVRVRGSGTPNSGTGESSAVLNKTDVTVGVGQSFTLSVSGTTSDVTWDVSDSTVISITDSGKVTARAAGKTTATARVDGKTLSCIVRVK